MTCILVRDWVSGMPIAPTKPKVIHRKQLFGGRMTAEQVHQKYAFPKNAKCICGRRPMLRVLTFATYADASQHYADIATMEPSALAKILVRLRGTDGNETSCVRLALVYCCESCEKTLSRQLAKLPSWILVEINRGPTKDKLVTSGV